MQQHGALGHARGAAGVLQQGDVVGLDVGRLSVPRVPWATASLKRTAPRQVERGHHLLDVAHDEVDQRALEQAQQVAHGGQHHMLDRRVGDALLQRGGEVLDDDDGLGAGVLELVLQFARRCTAG